MMNMKALRLIFLLALWPLSACQHNPAAEPVVQQTELRVIVRLLPGVEAERTGYLDRLGEETQTQISLLRRFSGQRYVLHVLGEGEAETILHRLRAHPDVELAQRDGLSRPN
jgi:hypothetical protein